MIGTQIGSYLIQEKLGEGGMGTVYRALETNLDRIVAIKVLNTDVSRDPEIVERFRSEARAQANLNHTNIATLYTLLVHEGSPVMVMEFVDGENFQQIVKEHGPMPTEEAVPLFRQALLGVGAAHRMGLIHRDIKPSNLMLNRAGLVKVMDFGIAKVAASDRGLTRTGMQVGTVYYMSPEQVKGEPADIRSDIYALGITLYQMVTGHVPFSADSDFKILTDHVQTPPPPPTSFNPAISKGLEAIILKALEKDPNDRFQTVVAFGAALERPETWEQRTAQPVSPVQKTVLEMPIAPAAAAGVANSGMAGGSAPGPNRDLPPPIPPRLDTPAPVHNPSNVVVLPHQPQARPFPRKVFAVVAALFAVVCGGFVAVRWRPASPDSRVTAAARTNSRSGGELDRSNSRDEVTTLFPGTAANVKSDSLPPNPARTKRGSGGVDGSKGSVVSDNVLRSGAYAGNSAGGSQPAEVFAPQPAQRNQSRPPRSTPAVQTPATDTPSAGQQAPAAPAASPAELEEARSRFIRLRSRAIALKSQLGDLRQRLASQGLSVRTEAIEAEGNLDSYMGEADRALQSGNLQSAQTNMDRAEHEEKRIAAVVGG